MELFDQTSLQCSKLITARYSTSFTMGIKALQKKFRLPIYAIYGFVRYADEIVDTFHNHDKKALLASFRADTYTAIHLKISLNPVLHSFQMVVNKYQIDHSLIEAFLKSMEMDLYLNHHDDDTYENYIYGSAEAVGLMCLKVFCEGDESAYQQLRSAAQSLGAAFQKVNFLRDIKSDYKERKRVYFPGVDFNTFTKESKKVIELSIMEDFNKAFKGIQELPRGARWGVYLAYIYYTTLFNKIRKAPPAAILTQRIRVSDNHKIALLVKTYFRHSFNNLKPVQ